MKQFKTLKALLILCLITLLSCSSDDDGVSITNSFNYENKAYTINFSFIENTDSGIVLYLTNADISSGNYTGEVSFIGIGFELVNLTEGTYNFTPNTNPEYDSSIHFSASQVGVMLDFVDGSPVGMPTLIQNLNEGSVIISQNGEANYQVEFTLQFDEGEITGSYRGPTVNLD